MSAKVDFTMPKMATKFDYRWITCDMRLVTKCCQGETVPRSFLQYRGIIKKGKTCSTPKALIGRYAIEIALMGLAVETVDEMTIGLEIALAIKGIWKETKFDGSCVPLEFFDEFMVYLCEAMYTKRHNRRGESFGAPQESPLPPYLNTPAPYPTL